MEKVIRHPLFPVPYLNGARRSLNRCLSMTTQGRQGCKHSCKHSRVLGRELFQGSGKSLAYHGPPVGRVQVSVSGHAKVGGKPPCPCRLQHDYVCVRPVLKTSVSLAEEDIAHQHWRAHILLVHRQSIAGYAFDLERREGRTLSLRDRAADTPGALLTNWPHPLCVLFDPGFGWVLRGREGRSGSSTRGRKGRGCPRPGRSFRD